MPDTRRGRSAVPPPGVTAAFEYAEAVLAGRVVACQLVHLTCRRFLNDVAAAAAGESAWIFRPELAERAMTFASLMPNIKGPDAGRPLRLMPWQRLVFANLLGFVGRETGERRFRQGIIFVPRGSGKTCVAAPLALYLSFLDGEGGAEGYAAAVTRDQARILFDTAREMVRRSPEIRKRYGVEALANSIWQERSSSHFRPISSDVKGLDGLNVQVAVCDEIASHRTSEVYDVLLTAMGKRRQPLLLSISTATGNSSGIGKQLWDYAVRVLQGVQHDERVFALIYTIDLDDDPWAESSWIKANPSWGQTVQPEAIRAIMLQARNNPAQESAAMTRHLDIWMGADEALFSTRAWRARADPRLRVEDYVGCEAHVGIDLASKTDLASCVITFTTTTADGALSYVVFHKSFLNEAAVLEARNASYPGWAADGYIEVTMGNETDFATIEDWLLDCCKQFRVLSVAYDPWAATQFAQRMLAQDVPMVEFRANTQNFSEPTKELDAAIRGDRIRHDGDPVLEWAIGNVVGRYDARSNVYPRKSRPENKIDPAVALIMTIGRCLARAEESPYADGRRLLII